MKIDRQCVLDLAADYSWMVICDEMIYGHIRYDYFAEFKLNIKEQGWIKK